MNSLDYSYNFTFSESTEYNSPVVYSSNYTFTDIYINSGKYRYYIKDTNDISYNSVDITPPLFSTFSFSNISSIINKNYTSINGDITILYPCYNSYYKFLAVHNSRLDISFSSIYTAIEIIQNNKINYSNKNTLTINNITRTGIYNLFLINTYNNATSVERSSTFQTTITIPYDI